MPHLYNTALLIGAALSAIAALLHIWVIATGPRGYRLCGAGDRFIKAAEAGKKFPAVVTAGIALVLFIWALYALSGAGLIAPLPLLRPALFIITFIYLLRGVAGPFALRDTGRSQRFIVVSSLICLGFGLVHLLGMTQRWGALA
ncbi:MULTISPECIES: hypothetical protein [Serratia]|uniref:hypothetical protein n=1 Tax=Serratia TaxID=613 RepID=UPI00035D9BFE|nr:MULTISPECIES: hypothetical protein [Serratia]AWO78503.1 hypothetical protein C1N78_07700 [Serratia marcescens]MCC7685994.1 hypothetical protein [Serratia marcescens]MDU3571223.1 hypothetical protein [Serratia marcescens]MDU3647168.1 hypothetical protein [Serratia marcescens]MDV2101134.1 hypothetical protein [Serratia marcescens]